MFSFSFFLGLTFWHFSVNSVTSTLHRAIFCKDHGLFSSAKQCVIWGNIGNPSIHQQTGGIELSPVNLVAEVIDNFWKPEKKCPFFCQIWWADNTVLVITCEDWCLFGLVLFKTCFKSSNYVLFVSLVSDLNYLFTVVSAIVDDPSMCLGWQFFVSRCQVILSCHFGCFSVLCFSQLKLLFFIPKQPVLIHLDWFI